MAENRPLLPTLTVKEFWTGQHLMTLYLKMTAHLLSGWCTKLDIWPKNATVTPGWSTVPANSDHWLFFVPPAIIHRVVVLIWCWQVEWWDDEQYVKQPDIGYSYWWGNWRNTYKHTARGTDFCHRLRTHGPRITPTNSRFQTLSSVRPWSSIDR